MASVLVVPAAVASTTPTNSKCISNRSSNTMLSNNSIWRNKVEESTVKVEDKTYKVRMEAVARLNRVNSKDSSSSQINNRR
jgi:hypothetical protein